MMSIEERIEELGYTLPIAPSKGGVYTPCREFGNKLFYVSGCGPSINGENIVGKLGKDVSFEEGEKAAKQCILNVLSIIKSQIGNLDQIKRFAKLLVFVSSSNDFYQQPQVANAASSLLCEIFGEEIGLAARSAIGVNVLPGDIAVEIEVLFEID